MAQDGRSNAKYESALSNSSKVAARYVHLQLQYLQKLQLLGKRSQVKAWIEKGPRQFFSKKSKYGTVKSLQMFVRVSAGLVLQKKAIQFWSLDDWSAPSSKFKVSTTAIFEVGDKVMGIGGMDGPPEGRTVLE